MNTTQTTVSAAVTYLVNTTNGADIPAGMVQLSANLRDTEGKKVAPEQRYRNVLIRELSLPDISDTFRPVLLDKLYSLAKERFEEAMTDSNRLATSVQADDYTVSGLLSYYATDAKSGRMTKESIAAWFNASATAEYIKGKKADAVAGYATNFAKLASPNHGINANTARALLAVLQEADLEHVMTKALASKLQATINKSESSLVEML